MTINNKKGLFCFVLNAHLPFVRHPENEFFRQENWLFDAVSETFLPLLRMMHGLEQDNIPFRFVISLSPTLQSMLRDAMIQDQFIQRMNQLLELADKEVARTKKNPKIQKNALLYRELLENNLADFIEKYDRNLLKAFHHFQHKGYLDIITTTATHCFLPLYQHHPQVLDAQIKTALISHESVFGSIPEGFWFPECGYYPGLEDLLKDYGIRYFFSSAHGLLYSSDRPKKGVYAPVQLPNGVAAFGMERSIFKALYSSAEGYPTRPVYRDFFRDIGYELPTEYVAPYMGSDIGRINTGFKYFSKTVNGENEKIYDAEAAFLQARTDAALFAESIVTQTETIFPLMQDRPPIMVSAYDAELFGHWWFEGIEFLDAFFRELHKVSDTVGFVTPSDYLDIFSDLQTSKLSFASWGEQGYSQFLLDSSNDWIYRHTNQAVNIMTDLANRYPDEKGLLQRTLNQAARETLLSLASDWPFIMKTGSAVSYAKRRIKSHIYNVNYIFESLSRKKVRADWLTKLEKRNNIFPEIDYRIFKTKK